jgi:uncharacterized lipoprotein YajG
MIGLVRRSLHSRCASRGRPQEAAKVHAEIRITGMKKYICLLAGLALFAACEQKETTVTNPPAEKKESNTTVINKPPAETTTKEKTEVNVNTSPSP